MKILFADIADAADVRSQSGYPFFIRETLKNRGHEVVDLSPLRPPIHPLAVIGKLEAKIRKQVYGRERSGPYLRHLARRIEQEAAHSRPDFLFSASSIPLTLVRSPLPKIYCADATFAALADLYPGLRNASPRYRAEADRQERAALRNADLAIYPSPWALHSALHDYGGDPQRVRLIPFGANLTEVPDRSTIEALARSRISERPIRFLFLGADWRRKGGETAVAIVDGLNRTGIDAQLEVVGPDRNVVGTSSAHARVHGFLDKRDAGQAETLRDLWQKCAFFLLPTGAEAFGISICEALAYGQPSIVGKSGGAASIVSEDLTGHLLDRDDAIDETVKWIRSCCDEPDRYIRMSQAARDSYESTFNWDRFVHEIELWFRDRVGKNTL